MDTRERRIQKHIQDVDDYMRPFIIERNTKYSEILSEFLCKNVIGLICEYSEYEKYKYSNWDIGGFYVYRLFGDDNYIGKLIKWNDLGMPIRECHYKDGMYDGQNLEWNSEGYLNRIYIYKNDNLQCEIRINSRIKDVSELGVNFA